MEKTVYTPRFSWIVELAYNIYSMLLNTGIYPENKGARYLISVRNPRRFVLFISPWIFRGNCNVRNRKNLCCQNLYFILQPWLLSLKQDATEAFLAAHHSPQACQKMQAFCVGE